MDLSQNSQSSNISDGLSEPVEVTQEILQSQLSQDVSEPVEVSQEILQSQLSQDVSDFNSDDEQKSVSAPNISDESLVIQNRDSILTQNELSKILPTYLLGSKEYDFKERHEKCKEWILQCTPTDIKLNSTNKDIISIKGLPMKYVTADMLKELFKNFKLNLGKGMSRSKKSYVNVIIQSILSGAAMKHVENKIKSKQKKKVNLQSQDS